MLFNYITIAIRNLIRNKVYAFINVVGLSIGLACTLLLALFVHHEWRYDRFHEKASQLYQVIRIDHYDGDSLQQGLLHPDYPAIIREAYPDIKQSARLIPSNIWVGSGETSLRKRVHFVDPDYLAMFSFPLVEGDPATALDHPAKAIMTQRAVKDFFGQQMAPADAVGQTISLSSRSGEALHTVSAVISTPPDHSSLRFDFLVPYENHRHYGRMQSGDSHVPFFVDLGGTPIGEAKQRLKDLSLALEEGRIEAARVSQKMDPPKAVKYDLIPLLDLHHYQELGSSVFHPSDPTQVRVLALIAGIVFLLSCVNYAMLTLSRSGGRSSEVGMRKVMGAHRHQLVGQFLGEALATTLIGLAGALVVAEMLLPGFSELTEKPLTLFAPGIGAILVVGGILVMFVALLGGSYPGFLLSRLMPRVLLTGTSTGTSNRSVTSSLMSIQYAIATGLIICTVVIVQQLGYVRSKYLGYTKDPILVVNLRGSTPGVEDRGRRFKLAMERVPGAISTALVSSSFTKGSSMIGTRTPEGQSVIMRVIMRVFGVDPDYLTVLGLTVSQGRFFSNDQPSDRGGAVVVNERFVRAFGWEEPVGQILPSFSYGGQPTVVGVVKDYHYDSLHKEIGPALLHMSPEVRLSKALVRLRSDSVSETLDDIRELWPELTGDLAFDFSFQDEDVDRRYRVDDRWARIVATAAGFAIFIACMGLFGQAALAISKRTKEIGIRKVLGAAAHDILALLSRDLVKLVAVSNLIAWPLAYYASDEWLSGFAYRISLSPALFVMGGCTALLVAIGTVVYLGLRAASTNPAAALRSE